jgi:FkbM family methyltransferase
VIVFDVGANKGEFSEHILENNGSVIVHAFEPNTFICSDSLNKLKERFTNRLLIHFVALSRNSGKSILHGSDALNGQLGSLLEINERSSGWDQHKNIFKNESIRESELEVSMKSIKDFIVEHGITEIDFLKIDTQGTDLEILEEFVNSVKIKSGVLEVDVGFSTQSARYINTTNDINSLFKILNKHDLIITKIIPNNSASNEINVFFSENIELYENLINELKLSTNPSLSRYWKVSGLGITESDTMARLWIRFIKKILFSAMHPYSSTRSVLLKLTK